MDGHNHSRKPDFRILTKIDDNDRELVFGEIKPPHCINKSTIKLAELMKGSMDCIINTYSYVVGLETYGILICGKFTIITFLTFDCHRAKTNRVRN